MGSHRVRHVGFVDFLRLKTGERVSKCGRFIVRPPALYAGAGKRWRVCYRDPMEVTAGSSWTFPLYDARKLAGAFEAVRVFDSATRRMKFPPEDLDAARDGVTSARVKVARRRRHVGLEALRAAEERGRLDG